MVKAIVGIEMPILKLTGKWKLSQNRTPADRLGVATALESHGDDQSRTMAAWIRQTGVE
jgi:transcriptional regulator